ncbi:uncharacterized protein BDV14DRAFT_132866 [Aspergillus stella-maris]|uniref:uncharacterized protein n=1 Tax=Aspergillus stella-maris TaxID=1810926 RepID=UPI003CCE1A01
MFKVTCLLDFTIFRKKDSPLSYFLCSLLFPQSFFIFSLRRMSIGTGFCFYLSIYLFGVHALHSCSGVELSLALHSASACFLL